ncbi:serine/threonine protein kinase [Mycobacterium avium subsp. paratuberculosis]|nr:protein kinase [Mycobacterium avium subsp. paratuberculosis]CAG6925502.1 serine/threonine protein kinase [Mycobacterium avium subsp. paratuberculosis]CAG6930675.1 serine/threonine protein kinase [Mycobacterium avium subsp. paratuberculosis]CAG6931502.1 serine/threonine protein kinase [Mycobacterium avium subsp. paratuberculosis]CAG6931555.1 serine/threonine protein kinase [Mycobacterium avium subsp. paratuberculosis]
MKSLVGTSFGQYEIRRLIGKGGMGEVYEAYDTKKGRAVALKLLTDNYADDEKFRERFLRESRAAAILQEPHVIPIHDWGEINGVLYIDMRLVQGQTLHEMLKTGSLEPRRATDIIRQVASALDAAHAAGLIHRDVKPQNIIVTPDDFAYLVDFGIAEARGDTHLTMAGHTVGTFDYMAPERFGDEETTSAVDVYALACVLYEALTGAKPFPVHSAEQAIRAHLSSPPPRPSAVNPHVPASFDDVIARGMAKHPDDRYGSAGALGRAAKRALAPDPATSAGTNTLLAPQYVSAPSSYPPFAAQYPYPATGPVSATDADQGGSKKLMVLTIVGVAVALLVGGTGLVIGLTTQRNSSTSEPSTSPLVSYTNPVPTYETEPARLPSTPTSAPQDATQQLHQIANDDRAFVRAQLADRWVPQLSSKRPGVVDNGVVWDNAMSLREHLQLRQRYPNVKLLWSGDWSTFSGPDFWVTVAGLTFADSSGPLAWCRFQGFDRDHCAAKLVSTTHPEAGSTAYN